MVRFVRYWIEKNMEDPVERERKSREHIAEVREGAERLKAQWNRPGRPKGYWNGPMHAQTTKDNLTKTAGNPTSEFEAALLEMDEKRIRDAANKK